MGVSSLLRCPFVPPNVAGCCNHLGVILHGWVGVWMGGWVCACVWVCAHVGARACVRMHAPFWSYMGAIWATTFCNTPHIWEDVPHAVIITVMAIESLITIFASYPTSPTRLRTLIASDLKMFSNLNQGRPQWVVRQGRQTKILK